MKSKGCCCDCIIVENKLKHAICHETDVEYFMICDRGDNRRS